MALPQIAQAVVTVLADAPATITPNTTGLPGLGTFGDVVGAAITYAFLATVLGLVGAMVTVAWAGKTANAHYQYEGKKALLWFGLAFVALGAINIIAKFFWDLGFALH